MSKHLEFPTISPVTEGVNRPLWSVMIPTYNCASYLGQTLKSVLEQAPEPEKMQIEVVDDYSTKDDPEAVVREIGQGRVSFYRQPQNVGAQANFNSCIQRAKGHWVHILHGDDYIMPGFYCAFERAFEQESDLGAAFCRYAYVDEHNHQKSLSVVEREIPGIISDWIERIAIKQRIQTPSIVVKRSVYEKLGGYHLKLIHAADWEMWKRIAVNYPVWFEPQLLACYRQHSTSDSSRLIRTGLDLADTKAAITISETYLPQSVAKGLSDRAREHYALRAIEVIARRMISRGDLSAAINQIIGAIKCSQSPKVIKLLVKLILSILQKPTKQTAS
ncbi:MAG: glycosyltransferase [Xenococcaceae cyanobacterium MO_188.B19]|nr:glycosyltransferase [Xenococcaceae cyanobacterium MO_188.B19]